MATEYTPATGDIRGIIEWRHRMARDRLTPEAFDRWLSVYTTRIREEAVAEERERAARIADREKIINHDDSEM